MVKNLKIYNCPACNNEGKLKFSQNIEKDLFTNTTFSSRKNPELMHHDLYQCGNCETLFTNDPFDYDELIHEYRKAGYDSNLEAEFAARTYVKLCTKFINTKVESVLDVGTGNGSFLYELEKTWNDTKLVGLEPSLSAIKKLTTSAVEIYPHSLEEAKFDYKFDLVTCFQTIEHVINPQAWVNRFSDLLTEKGLVSITCHNHKSVVNRIMGKKSPIFDIEHLQIFTKKGIRNLFEKNGFEIIQLDSYRNNYPLSYWIKVSPLQKGIKKLLLRSNLAKIKLPINVGNIYLLGRKL